MKYATNAYFTQEHVSNCASSPKSNSKIPSHATILVVSSISLATLVASIISL